MRPTFEFRLEPLLDWRRRAEREREREFALRRRALAECSDELEQNQAARARCADTADLRLRDAHLSYLERAGAALRASRLDLEAACDRARLRLASAHRERRVVESLKERRRRIFDAAQARREELEIDEGNARRLERARRKRFVS